MKTRNEAWVEFWQRHGSSSETEDEQTQVLRTYSKEPISQQRWAQTLGYVASQVYVSHDDVMLDLCSGNGLFAEYFSPRCRGITAVDISSHLLEKLKQRKLSNVKIVQSDIRDLSFSKGVFSRILLYAGIQYLNEVETIVLFKNMFNWLKPGGFIYIGDIPDRSRLWKFYNTKERQALYFNNQLTGRDVVGTWFDSTWLVKLSEQTGFESAQVHQQPKEQIYAHFRFDLKAQR